jgi:four helix bundle protein
MAFSDFTQFSVWKKAFDLLLLIYRLTETFPAEERYGMVSDMRRAANSVAHNIAEGYGRYERRDKTRFYKISRGSAYELLSQLLVSNALGYLTDQSLSEARAGYQTVIEELDRLIKSVESRP